MKVISDKAPVDFSQTVAQTIRNIVSQGNINSIEEINDIAKQLSQHRDQSHVNDFLGLSPESMHRMLYKPFESPELIQFVGGYAP